VEKRCTCSGHWTRKLQHYFVTQRGYKTELGIEIQSQYSEIKCRQCRRKWRSKAEYVEKLPDGKERTYKKLTEQDVFQLMQEGRIEVDPETSVVRKQSRPFGVWSDTWITLTQTPDKKADPYLFVDIKNDGARKWAAVHRLVWMQANNKLIPEGYDVDHDDRNRQNNNIHNLRLRTILENRGDIIRSGDDIPF